MLSHVEVAKKLKRKSVDADTVKGWERGEGQPTTAQLRALAQFYRVPERWLYYPEPPVHFDDLGLVDFRTDAGQPLITLSQNLRSSIQHALAIQTWVSDYRAYTQQEPVSLVGARSDHDSPVHVASYLRDVLGLEQLRNAAGTSLDFLKQVRAQLEDVGVLVLRMGQVANKTPWSLDPEEFKGFTLIDEDKLAPLVFINRKDLPDAQLFTLGHELAHLVTGGTGVSNEEIDNFDDNRPRIERFCDEVAEELLVPSTQFENLWGRNTKGLEPQRVDSVAAELKVTPLLAGRRAVSLKRVSQHSFYQFVARYRSQPTPKKRPGGNPYTTMPSWYGRRLTHLLASAATSGYHSGSDALALLGVSFATARRLAECTFREKNNSASSSSQTHSRLEMKRFPLIELDDSWRNSRP